MLSILRAGGRWASRLLPGMANQGMQQGAEAAGGSGQTGQESPGLQERYVAAMVLGAVGDAMGYYNGRWEFCRSGSAIHEEVEQLGGVANLKVCPPDFDVSDDTVLHIATAEGLVLEWNGDKDQLFHIVAGRYIARSHDMGGRAPGITTMTAIATLRPGIPNGYRIRFNRQGGGCGAAMRSAPIGLAFPRPDQLDDLVAVAIETGRMTHNHPTGYLGSLATALFVSYAIQGKPPRAWGAGLMETLGKAWQYVEKAGKDVEENRSTWDYFTSHWKDYLRLRGIEDGASDPTFPEHYGVEARDQFYKSVSFSGWGGASGHDAPMIAYDAILGAGASWEELCRRAVLHGGDSDSTGIIACAAWGAMYGFSGVPEGNYKQVEFLKKLQELAEQLYKVGTPHQESQTAPEAEHMDQQERQGESQTAPEAEHMDQQERQGTADENQQITDQGDQGGDKGDQGKDQGDQGGDKGDQGEDKGDQGEDQGDQGKDQGDHGKDKGDHGEDKGDQGEDKGDQGEDKGDQGEGKGDQGGQGEGKGD